MRDTKLGDEEIDKIIRALNENIQKLDLSNNPGISQNGYKKLCDFVLDVASFNLTDLSLEQNRIDDNIL